MSFGIAVNSLDLAGGPQVVQVNQWYRVQGEPIVVVGDLVESHGPVPHSPRPPMAEGSSWFRVGLTAGGGIPVSRAGHEAVCGHATSGRPWFRIEP